MAVCAGYVTAAERIVTPVMEESRSGELPAGLNQLWVHVYARYRAVPAARERNGLRLRTLTTDSYNHGKRAG